MNKYELYDRLCKQGHFDLAQRCFDQIQLEESRDKDPNKLSQREIDELFKEQERGNKK